MADIPERHRGHAQWAGSFIGRDRELAQVAAMFSASVPLVTLIGPGGIGKTWLAAEAARQFQGAVGAFVIWSRLARLPRGSDVSTVEEEVAQSVVEVDFSSRSAWEVLVDSLNRLARVEEATLLVVDNCEHVLPAAGQVIAKLLASVPGLTVLATSREAIGWVDEGMVRVPPLTREQAAALFRQRASSAGVHLGSESDDAVADICRHVHRHPLYVRLAAARLRYQPLVTILQELSGTADDRRMRWPPGPRAGTDARHHAIHDVIDWSYELCSEPERLLLQRMSVFAAGFEANPEDPDEVGEVGVEMGAIEEVCGDRLPVERGVPGNLRRPTLLQDSDIDELLMRLVDRSLVTLHIGVEVVRYSLLESIRVFARERLDERAPEEWRWLQRRHLIHFRNKVVFAETHWLSPAGQGMMDWVRAAWDNIRIAIDTSLQAPDDALLGVEIASGLIALRAPVFRGSLREVRRWMQRTLDTSREATREIGLPHVLAQALICWVALCQGQRADAVQALEGCIAIAVPVPADRPDWRRDCDWSTDLLAPVDFLWGVALMMIDRDPRAIRVLGRAREKYADTGRDGAVAVCELFEALAAALLGSVEEAVALADRHLLRVTRAGAVSAVSWAQLAKALALVRKGDAEAALTLGRTALACQLEIRDQWGALWAVHVRMWTLARMVTDRAAAGDRAIAAPAAEIARLIGGTRALRVSIGVEIEGLGPFSDATDHAAAVARRALGPGKFEVAVQQGESLRPDRQEVQLFALGALIPDEVHSGRTNAVDDSTPWSALTSTEQEVALLAAAGFANTAIARRRGKSFKTIDAQMSTIFQKLMISARTEIIRFIPVSALERVRVEAAALSGKRSARIGRKSNGA